jgi:hypothetical protein
MRAEQYPLEMVRPSSGRTETAFSKADETELRARGFQRLHETPQEYGLFPLFLTGSALPDLIVENEDQAKEAAERGYDLPSQAELALAEEGFCCGARGGTCRGLCSVRVSQEPSPSRASRRHPDALAL